jgi:hypothetical protein
MNILADGNRANHRPTQPIAHLVDFRSRQAWVKKAARQPGFRMRGAAVNSKLAMDMAFSTHFPVQQRPGRTGRTDLPAKYANHTKD